MGLLCRSEDFALGEPLLGLAIVRQSTSRGSLRKCSTKSGTFSSTNFTFSRIRRRRNSTEMRSFESRYSSNQAAKIALIFFHYRLLNQKACQRHWEIFLLNFERDSKNVRCHDACNLINLD